MPLTPANVTEKSQQQEIHSRVYLIPQVTTDPMNYLILLANTAKSLHNYYVGQRVASRRLRHPFCWIDLLDEDYCSSLLAQNLASLEKSQTFDEYSALPLQESLWIVSSLREPLLGYVGLCAASTDAHATSLLHNIWLRTSPPIQISDSSLLTTTQITCSIFSAKHALEKSN